MRPGSRSRTALLRRIVDAPGDVARAGAEEFARVAREAVKERGKFAVALAGGSTPRGLYQLLAVDPGLRGSVPWTHTHLFWSDERHVPSDHPDSNYRMVEEALLQSGLVPAANVHRIRAGQIEPDQIAADYEAELIRWFGLGRGEFPRFDLVLLGLGADGHTASLFPGTTALQETDRIVVATWVEHLRAQRITFTFPTLDHARRVVFLVSGAAKAETVAALFGSPETSSYPAGRVRPSDGEVLWILDRAAAAAIPA